MPKKNYNKVHRKIYYKNYNRINNYKKKNKNKIYYSKLVNVKLNLNSRTINRIQYSKRSRRLVRRYVRTTSKKFRKVKLFFALLRSIYRGKLQDGVVLKNVFRRRTLKIRLLRSYLNRKIRILSSNYVHMQSSWLKRKYTNLVRRKRRSKLNLLLKRQLLRGDKLDLGREFYRRRSSLLSLSSYGIKTNVIQAILGKKEDSNILSSFYRKVGISNKLKGFRRLKKIHYVTRYFNRPLLRKRVGKKMFTPFNLFHRNRLNRKLLISNVYRSKRKKNLPLKSKNVKFKLLRIKLYNELRNFSNINKFNNFFYSNLFLSPFSKRAKIIKKFNFVNWFSNVNRKFTKRIRRLNKPFFSNYKNKYASLIDNSIKGQLSNKVALNYISNKFLYNKRKTRFLRYRGVYLGRSKYRLFKLLKNRLNYIRNQEYLIRTGNFSFSRFHYNNVLLVDRTHLKGLNSIQGKYGQRKAGYWWRIPRRQRYRWWKLKGRSHLSLFFRNKKVRVNKKINLSKSYKKKNILKVVLRQATNNYFINVMRGDKTLFMTTAGMAGFKGPKRRSWFAAQQLSKQIAYKLLKRGCKKVNLEIRSEILSKHSNEVLKGLLKVTASSVKRGKKKGVKRSVKKSLKINTLTTVYSRAHNGLRARKARRL